MLMESWVKFHGPVSVEVKKSKKERSMSLTAQTSTVDLAWKLEDNDWIILKTSSLIIREISH